MNRITRRKMCGGLVTTAVAAAVTSRAVAAATGQSGTGGGKPLSVKFLGTGAADHQWNRIGEPDVRGSCSTMLDNSTLIDCGATGIANLQRANIDPNLLQELIFTHSHSDHFNVQQVGQLLAMRRKELPPLRVRATHTILSALKVALSDGFEAIEIKAGDTFAIGRMEVTALPANHLIAKAPDEQALHYLVKSPVGNLLYALDGAWMLKPARLLIGKTRLDMIIWDATMVGQKPDFRIFEHNDLAMIRHIEATLRMERCIDDNSVRVLNHMARTLWPTDLRESERLVADDGWTLAADGLELMLNNGHS